MALFAQFTRLILIVFLLNLFIYTVLTWEYSLERLENKHIGLVQYHLRHNRINRTTFGISGNATYMPQVTKNPEKYFVSIIAELSPKGNNQYMLLPLRLPKTDLCTYYQTAYRKYMMKPLKPPVSDAIYTEDPNEDLCEVFRSPNGRIDTVNNYYLDKSTLPAYLSTGLYRVTMVFSDEKDENIGDIIAYIRVF